MEKLSVQKPFTVLVAVIIVLALGGVSMTSMTTDLLPDMSLPYLMVIVPYPGASPEKVEAEVTLPMENALGVVKNVENVHSVNSENYATIQLEFASGTNMDSALVNVSSAVNQVAAGLPAGCGTPTMLEIGMNMIATMYVAVSREGDDVYALSDYVDREVIPAFQRQNGVASVTAVGLVEKSIQVDLNREKIDELNARILEHADSALNEAREALEEAQRQVDEGQQELEKQQSRFGRTLASSLFRQIDAPASELSGQLRETITALIEELDTLQEAISGPVGEADDTLDDINAALDDVRAALETLREQGQIDAPEELSGLISALRELYQLLDPGSGALSSLFAAAERLNAAIVRAQNLLDQISAADAAGTLDERISAARDALNQLYDQTEQVPGLLDTLEKLYAGLSQGQLDAAVAFAAAAQQLTQAQTQLAEAFAQYDAAREQALSSANIDMLVDSSTLSQLIYAQNFAMPAGYIDDENDNSWLLRVGEEYGSEADIAGALLSDIDGIGTIRISDIADITVIDNAGLNYANLNGEDGIMLCVFKSSTAGTNAVSRACDRAMRQLMADDARLSMVKLVDQGKYITLIVNSIVESMALGALLAILVLALFLKDIRPTIIVGISIPLSVLFALVLMYFTKLSLNMMTLSGLALGIGMLVDNSIVVMENIVRLKTRGMAAPRAAVQGTKQVAGSIIASTLTTISVFVPMIFTEGTVRELLVPLSLSVSYCLIASLLVAVTVIPASASTILSRVAPKPNRTMERVQAKYGVALRWCLGHKPVALAVSIALLVFSIYRVLTMGIVILPSMTSDTISVTITTPEEDDRWTSYHRVDEVMDAMLSVDGIDDIGIMDSGSVLSSVSALAGRSSGSYGRYICYVTLPDGTGSRTIERMIAEIKEKTADFDFDIDVSSSGMMDFTSFFSSGLSINIYGGDGDELARIAAEVAEAVRNVEGFTDVSDGSEDASATLHLIIDKDKAMEYGLTVAQIYAQIAGRLATDVTGTSITVEGVEMDVTVSNNTDPLTRENLLDMEFTANSFGAAAGGDMSSMMGAFAGFGETEEPETETSEDVEAENDEGENGEEPSQDDQETADASVHYLREFATIEETQSASSIERENLRRYVTVSATTAEGYNTTVLSRTLQPEIDRISATLPNGYSIVLGGESEEVNDMVVQMLGLAALGLLFIYLVMVAQFQSLLSPFIILFTVPLAFTGGMLGLIVAGQQMSMLALMGFLILMGTVVNNGIVFVDYTNQLRLGGMEKWDALVATGQTRMRPILMTTLTTILAMAQLIFGDDMGSQLGGGMSIVIAGGLLYATLMTLFIIPIMYDILYRKQPNVVDVGDDINDVPDDAAEFLEQLRAERESQKSREPQENTEKTP